MKEFLLSLKYARRELRAGLKGFYIFLACLILGTASVAGVQSLSAGLLESLYRDGRYILGGDVALRTMYQPATPGQIRFLTKNIGPVNIVVETRAMARREDGEKAALVEVKAVDPFYPLYGKVEFADGDGKVLEGKVPQDMILPSIDPKTNQLGADWGAAVASEVLTRLGLKVGDNIMVGQSAFVIRGVITREPDRVGAQSFSIAPRVMISSAAFKGTGLASAGSQVYYDHRIAAPYAKNWDDMQKVMQKIEKAYPDASWRGRTFFNASPRLERRINQLTQYLTLIALTALMIGGVGISNAVRSFLDSKLANIATLKCLGASAQFVTRTYMAMVMMLTGLGVLAGVALGAGAAYFAGGLLTAKLALTNYMTIYPNALLLAAGFGFLASFCFSLWPIGRAARVTPNDLFRDAVQPSNRWPALTTILWVAIAAQALALLAIVTAQDQFLATWFIAGSGAAFAAFALYAAAIKRVLKTVRAPANPALRLALRNLTRPGNAATGVILSLGLGLTVLVATSLAQDNFSKMLNDELSEDTPSFFFLDVEPEQKDAFAQFLKTWPTAKKLQMAPSFRGRITAVNGKPPEEALVDRNENWVIESERGLTWTATPPPNSQIIEGEWWPENYDGPPAVSIATNVARAFDIGVGDELTLNVYGADVTAKVMNVREIAWSSFTMNFAVTFAPGLISKAPSNFLATVILDPKQEEPLQTELSKQFPNVTAVRVRDALDLAQMFIRAIAQAVAISAGVTLLGGVLVLAGGIAAARRRHVYDSIVLKVLGAERRRILATFLYEYGTLGVLAALMASGFGTLAAWAVITQVMHLQWYFSPLWLVLVVLGSLAVTVLAGFAGTWQALMQKPAPYLRNQ